ncbi:hypothetical protein RDABS01_030424 [Bienertia sinuspersici]
MKDPGKAIKVVERREADMNVRNFDGLMGLGLKLEDVQGDVDGVDSDAVEKSDHLKVKETLRAFNNYYLRLIQEEENRCKQFEAKKNKDKRVPQKRPDLKAITKKILEFQGILASEKWVILEAIFGLKVWKVIGIVAGLFIIIILALVPLCLTARKKARKANKGEIKEIRVEHIATNAYGHNEGNFPTLKDKFSDQYSDKTVVPRDSGRMRNGEASSQSGSFHHVEGGGFVLGDEGGSGSGSYPLYKPSSSHPITTPSPLSGLPKFSHLGWGHWFILRDLKISTNKFSKENVIGEGGHGIVGQAKEFRVEVDAIGHVRYKNLVRLLGYCGEGNHSLRVLVFEYVNNDNLEQWLHGAMRQHGYLTWEARIKVVLGTGQTILFIGEIHTVVEAGLGCPNGAVDAGKWQSLEAYAWSWRVMMRMCYYT